MDKNQDLLNRREASKIGGGDARIEKQHSQGKLTARERIELLLDEGSFQERLIAFCSLTVGKDHC